MRTVLVIAGVALVVVAFFLFGLAGLAVEESPSQGVFSGPAQPYSIPGVFALIGAIVAFYNAFSAKSRRAARVKTIEQHLKPPPQKPPDDYLTPTLVERRRARRARRADH